MLEIIGPPPDRPAPMVRRVRLAAWAATCLIGLASVVPGDFEWRTGAPSELEHFVAYASAGGLFGFAYMRRWLVIAAAVLISGACALELVQIFVPGRTPRLLDALVSSGGALVGLAAGAYLRRTATEAKRGD
ncbi:MAG: VanZ family protein [Rhizobiales bacterium]|nr:VanZ family protein [Hyphomicrobiales bacterium]